MPVNDHDGDISVAVREISETSSERDLVSCHALREPGEQQKVYTRFGRLIKPVSRLIQTMSTQRVYPFLEV